MNLTLNEIILKIFRITTTNNNLYAYTVHKALANCVVHILRQTANFCDLIKFLVAKPIT